MKNKIAIAVSHLLCLAVLLLSILRTKDEELLHYDLVFFGDSIIASDHNDVWTIPVMLSEKTDMSVLNAAIGGSTLSDISSTKKVGDVSPLYSMVLLARSICDDDFRLQINASQIDNVYADKWRSRVTNELKQLRWDEVQYIIIEQGVNDYLSGVPIDDTFDKYNNSTFGGALRVTIEKLKEKANNAEIIIMTPIYIFPDGYQKDCLEMDFGGGTLDQYGEKEKEIATEYGIYFIDSLSELDINASNYENYIPGGLHGNFEGNKLIADNIVRHIKELDERN